MALAGITNTTKNPAGGQHHMCYEVPDIHAARAEFEGMGKSILGETRIGAHGTPIMIKAKAEGIALTALYAKTGLLGAPLGITLALCSACLAILFLETAFGAPVGEPDIH